MDWINWDMQKERERVKAKGLMKENWLGKWIC